MIEPKYIYPDPAESDATIGRYVFKGLKPSTCYEACITPDFRQALREIPSD